MFEVIVGLIVLAVVAKIAKGFVIDVIKCKQGTGKKKKTSSKNKAVKK